MTAHNDHGGDLRQLFFETAQELLQSLNDDALKLEQAPADAECWRSIRRAVHTLKGDSAACGFTDISELAHEAEQAFEAASAESRTEAALAAADAFTILLDAHRSNAPAPDVSKWREKLQSFASASPARDAAPSSPKAAIDKRLLSLVATLDKACASPQIAEQMLHQSIASIGRELAFRSHGDFIEARIESGVDEATIALRCRIPFVIQQVKVSPVSKVPDPNLQGPELPAPAAAVLRIEAERVDRLLDLAGELVVARSTLQQAIHEFSAGASRDPLRVRMLDAFSAQSRIISELQKSVLKIRMVNVGRLFRRMSRVVRDAAQFCGKQVQLEIRGAETELDRSILDALSDPLLHLVRNAVDHGIESPAARTTAGKPEQGVVRLNAYHQGNHAVIEVSDDGRGIDCDKVVARAVETGLLDAFEGARLTREAACMLIFEPGLSTADEVTQLSGRGLGMDVVKNSVERLSGAVTLESTPGQGTTFRIKVPLTLAILKGLLVHADGRTYAIPVTSVNEIIRATPSDIHLVDGRQVIWLRDHALPLLRIGSTHQDSQFFAVVITVNGSRYALAVDELGGEEELVIKGIHDGLVTTDLVSGASILGNGRVALLLNLLALVERTTATALPPVLPPMPHEPRAGGLA